MILHRLRVAHWRHRIDPVDLGPFDERLNVLHAPNGTGKSSLFEALRCALFDAHTVGGADIEAVRPWTRNLAPQVVVEFSERGVRYRVAKSFLEGAASRLERLENGAFRPLAEGRAADTRLREILGAPHAPGRGLSRPEHWGLAQALWAPQGALPLDALSPHLTDHVRASLGAQLAAAGHARLEGLIEEMYGRYFTPAGKTRTGRQAPPIVALESQFQEASAEIPRLQDAHREFEEATRQVQESRNRRDQARRDAHALQESILQHRAHWDALQNLRRDLADRRAAETIARERFQSLSRALEEIQATRAEIARLQAVLDAGERDLQTLDSERLAAERSLLDARTRRDELRRRRDDCARAQQELEDGRAHHDDLQTSRALAHRLELYAGLEAERRVLQGRRDALIAPDPRVIREVRQWLAARDQARARLEASLIHLTLTAERPLTVHPDDGSAPRALEAGDSTTFSGSPQVGIRLEGLGTVRASGPTGDTEVQRQTLAKATQQVSALTAPFATEDPERLQALREQADALDADLRHARDRIAQTLDGASAETLRLRLAETQARLEQRRARYPAWSAAPPELRDLQARVEAQRQEIDPALHQAETAVEAAQTGVQNASTRHSQLATELRHARLNLEAARQRLAAATRDGLSDADRERQRQETSIAWESARAQLADGESRLKAFPDNLANTLAHLDQRLQRLRQAEQDADAQAHRAEGRLQTLATAGAYSKLAACEERLAHLDAQRREERLRMDAVRLLHETVEACKAAALESVSAPVEQAATRLFARVAGERLGRVRLSNDLVPRGVQPDGLTDPVDLGQVSAGEHEQLHLVTRLALAEVLARDERQLVVLDDALNATDETRHAILLGMFQEAADRLQIVLLTCHPERYRPLAGALFIPLAP